MLNQLILVGRIFSIKDNFLILSVASTFKNKDGKYDNYKIKVYMKGSIGKNVKEYCHKGDIIGIKGHIENNMKLVIDKASFLSSSHQK